jgi:leucyl aminopeptidase (aminopeptidase T)
MHRSLQADFRSFSTRAFAIGDILSSGSKAIITSEKGANLKLSIKNRVPNPAPGWCYEKESGASLPDAETNVAIIEDESEGILVVDGSIPYDGLGLLSHSVKMIIKKGRVQEIFGPKNYIEILNKIIFDINESDLRRTPAEDRHKHSRGGLSKIVKLKILL